MSHNITRKVPNRSRKSGHDWQGQRPIYEAAYLMRLGNLNRRSADELIEKYAGDRNSINAELIARRAGRALESTV